MERPRQRRPRDGGEGGTTYNRGVSGRCGTSSFFSPDAVHEGYRPGVLDFFSALRTYLADPADGEWGATARSRASARRAGGATGWPAAPPWLV
jgi:hypothetical protein